MSFKKLFKTKLSVLIFSFSVFCLTLAFFLSGLTWKQLVAAIVPNFPHKSPGSTLTTSDWNGLANDFGQCILVKEGTLEFISQDGKSVSKPFCPSDFPYLRFEASLRAFNGVGDVNYDDWIGVRWVDLGNYWQIQAGDCDVCHTVTKTVGSYTYKWHETQAIGYNGWGNGAVVYHIYCCKTYGSVLPSP